MSNPEHLNIISRGVSQWNTWRRTNPEIIPDLQGADLSKMNLSKIDLSNAILKGTNFSNSILAGSNFENSKTGVIRPNKLYRAFAYVYSSSIFFGFCSYTLVFFYMFLIRGSDLDSPYILVASISTLVLFFVIRLVRATYLSETLIQLGGVTLVVTVFNLSTLYQTKDLTLDIPSNTVISMFGVFFVFVFSMACNVFSRTLIRLSIATSSEGEFNRPPIIWEVLPSATGIIIGLCIASHFVFDTIFVVSNIIVLLLVNLGKVQVYSVLGRSQNNEWIYDRALRLVCRTGTKFIHADLTSSSFRSANLAGSDFTRANIDFVCWADTQFLDLSIFDDRSMLDLRVRHLLQTGDGEGKNYAEAYLKNLKLDSSNLRNADLSDANLLNCSLENSDLSHANLSRVRASGANFERCKLTGAYGIGTWKITPQTSFQSVDCLYLHLEENKEDRQPADRDFSVNEFVELVEDSLARERPFRKVSVRLKKNDLKENIREIYDLVEDFEVQAVFEPFFDNKAIDTLLLIKDFGVAFSSGIRILTTKKNLDRGWLTKKYFIDKILTNFPLAEIRFMPGKPSQDEHRRFFLLGDQYSLIIGLSLNNPEKDEVASLDFSKYDEDFLNEKWNYAETLADFAD